MPLIFYLANNCCLTLCFMKCPGIEIRFCPWICISDSCWQSSWYHTLSWAPSRTGQVSRHGVSPPLPSAAAMLSQNCLLWLTSPPHHWSFNTWPQSSSSQGPGRPYCSRKNLGLGNIRVLSLGSKVVEKLFNHDGPSKMGIKINLLKSLSWWFKM